MRLYVYLISTRMHSCIAIEGAITVNTVVASYVAHYLDIITFVSGGNGGVKIAHARKSLLLQGG